MLHEESLALRQKLGDTLGIAFSLSSLAWVLLAEGDYQQAIALHQESLAVRRALGDRRGIARSLDSLGYAVLLQGDPARAITLIDESLAEQEELGDRRARAHALGHLGYAWLAQGDHERAALVLRESLLLHQELDDKRGMAFCVAGLAAVAIDERRAQHGVTLFGAADALRDVIHFPLWPVLKGHLQRYTTSARTQLDEATWQEAWAKGRVMSPEQAIAYALEGTR